MKNFKFIVAGLLTLAGCNQSTDSRPVAETILATPETSITPIVPRGPYQTTGIKIGEVTSAEAIVWTRLTQNPERVGSDAPWPNVLYKSPDSDELQEDLPGRFHPHDWVPVVTYPEGYSLDNIDGAVRGAEGELRVEYRPEGSENWLSTEWQAVDPEQDFTSQFMLINLLSGADYEVRVESRQTGSTEVSSAIEGHFRTAPSPDVPARVVFAATTGQDYEDQDAPGGGFRMYPSMMDLDVDFFVHTGDIVYYDAYAKNVDLARWGWARMYSLPTNMEFQRNVTSYFIKDDHDTWQDDTWPTQESSYMGALTFQDGVRIFKEQVPMNDLTYRTYRWGQDLQVWLVEGRDYRDENEVPDYVGKSIWGEEQKAWFKETVEASDATFKILISPTPMVGPDNEGKTDSHANVSFDFEGSELRKFMADQDNMITIVGDRHWQYVSVDDETGLREYATGPASDTHTSGWSSNDDVRPEHRYLNIIGGFLSTTVERVDEVPTMAMRHYGVDGNLLNEHILTEAILAAD